MTARPLLPALCLAAAFMLAPSAASAQADEGRRGGRGGGPPERGADVASRFSRMAPPPRAARNDSLADSVRRVQSRTGGQVLSAERVPFDGRDINRVKVVDERGRVRVYMDDPASRRPPRPTRRDDD